MKTTSLIRSLAIMTCLSAFSVALAAPAAPKVGNPNSIICKSVHGDYKLDILLGSAVPMHMFISGSKIDSTGAAHGLDQLNMTDSPFGRLISGNIPFLADAVQSYTLITPVVLVDLENETPLAFNTQMVSSFWGGNWGGDLTPGIYAINEYVDMKCVAQFIFLTK